MQIAHDILGLTIRVSFQDSEVGKRISSRFGQYEVNANEAVVAEVHLSGSDPDYLVTFEGRTEHVRFGRTWPDIDDLYKLILTREKAPTRFLHASCAAFENLGCIFVGSSTSGKTTLAWALEEYGAQLVSDDLTPVDFVNGQVERFLTKPTVREDTLQIAHQRHWSERNVSNAKWVQPNFIFLLDWRTSRPEAYYEASEGLAEWSKLYRVVCGDRIVPPRHSALELRTGLSFDREPSIERCTSIDAMRHLGKHMHSPKPSFETIAAEFKNLSNTARFYRLLPGKLSDTLSLVMDMIGRAE